MLQEPSIQKMIQKTEAFYLADNAKNMPIVDEYLYYAVDMKMNSIEMTEKGREFVTKKGEDSDFFVIPDLGSETALIEQSIEELEKEKVAEIEHNDAFSDNIKRIKF